MTLTNASPCHKAEANHSSVCVDVWHQIWVASRKHCLQRPYHALGGLEVFLSYQTLAARQMIDRTGPSVQHGAAS